jgi:hypothetical protein
MFPSSCLFGLSLATILLQVVTFEIQIGTAAQLLKEWNIKEISEANSLFVRRTLIFPYDVYEKPSPGSTAK